MDTTINKNNKQETFLELLEKAKKYKAQEPENDKDFTFYGNKFLENSIFLRTNEAWFYYENYIWRGANDKKLIERAGFIHPNDDTKHRTEILNKAKILYQPEQNPPIFDSILLEEEIPLNGIVLNVLTKHIRKITPSDYITTYIPHNYDPEAKCPLWINSIQQWLNNEQILLLQEFFGYILTGRTNLKKCLILYGISNAGKTRPLLIAQHMVGAKNTCAIDPRDMENPNKLAQIYGKKLNAKDELGELSKLGEGFRSVLDGAPTSINEKYQPQITINPIAKHIFTTNILPKMGRDKKANDANLNRLLFLEFVNPIEQIDPNLIYKLYEEIQGIINWSIEGLVRLLQNQKFTEVKNNLKLIEEYKKSYSSDLELFINSEFEFDPDYEVENKEFIKQYINYTFGERNAPSNEKWNNIEIGRQINALGFKSFQKSVKGKKIGMYKGLRFKIEDQQILQEYEKPKLKQINF